MSLHEDVRLLAELVNNFPTSGTEDLESDLIALAMLKEARTNLGHIERELENLLAKSMDDKRLVVENVGVFERAKKKNRTEWDRDNLVRVVLDSRMFDADGTDATDLEKVRAVWNLGAPRTTVLRELGIDPDEFCHSEDAGWSIRLITS